MSIKKQASVISVILILAFTLRIHDITHNPPGLFADEAIIGNAAVLLLSNASDLKGNIMPIFPYTTTGYRNPLEIYPLIPLIAVFGPTVFAIRFTSVVFSVFTVLIAFIFGKKLHSPALGFSIALIFSVCPWVVHFGRTGFLAQNVFVFLILTGCLFALFTFRKSRWGFYPAIAIFSLSAYTYFPARFISPLVLIGFLYLSHVFKKVGRRDTARGIIFTGLLLIPVIMHTVTPEGSIRLYSVTNFSSGVSVWFLEFIQKYIRHFSIDYLFLSGDAGMEGQTITRHSIVGLGQLHIFQLPLILVGLLWLKK